MKRQIDEGSKPSSVWGRERNVGNLPHFLASYLGPCSQAKGGVDGQPYRQMFILELHVHVHVEGPLFCSQELEKRRVLCSSRKNPYPPHGKSLEIPRGRGVLKVKILEAKYEAKLEFPGGRGGTRQKTFCGGSLNIFQNCTFYFCGINVLIVTF